MRANAAQIDMFADLPARRPNVATPAARKRDPETSHLAADALTDSGGRKEQQARAHAAVKAFPDRTSFELALLTGINRHELGRRLPEVRTAALVHNPIDESRPTDPVTGQPWPFKRVCSVSGRLAMVWRPGPGPETRS